MAGIRRFFVVLLVLVSGSSVDAAIASLSLSGPTGESVSLGQSVSLTYDDQKGSMVTPSSSMPIGLLDSQFSISLRDPIDGDAGDFANFRVRTDHLSAPLAIGTYAATETINPPPISIGFQGRGLTLRGGTFEITKVEFDATGAVSALDVSFDVLNAANPSPLPLTGSLSFSAVSAIPEPACCAVLMGFAAVAGYRRRSRR